MPMYAAWAKQKGQWAASLMHDGLHGVIAVQQRPADQYTHAYCAS